MTPNHRLRSLALAPLLGVGMLAGACGSADSATPATAPSGSAVGEGLTPAQLAIDPESYFRDYAGAMVDASTGAAAPAPGVLVEDASGESQAPAATTVARPAPPLPPEVPEIGEDNTFTDEGFNDFVATGEEETSTFALDVDTGSYNVGRAFVDAGQRPPSESVRPEEYLNFFDYGYEAPTETAMSISIDGAPSAHAEGVDIVRIGVSTRAVDTANRPPAAITFVVDVSGSMDIRDRLGLVKSSLALLAQQLAPTDTIAIVTYSNDSGVILEPTPVAETQTILDAIDALQPGGGTNLEAGMRNGYRLASEAYRDDAVNIVLLASDGVANIGDTGPDSISETIRTEAGEGINLVTVGYGLGNFNDTLMEQLADQGDGFYSYLNDFEDAELFFRDQLTQTLVPIARDAKAQVIFDPAVVSSYRLIGYENRALAEEDFRDDAIDAGELGSGHSATALYEIRRTDPVGDSSAADQPLGEVFLRWEDPNDGTISEVSEPIEASSVVATNAEASPSLRLAATVAATAELLADHPVTGPRAITLASLADDAEALAAELPADPKVEGFATTVRAAAGIQ